jgi:hypothetical protein
VVKLILLILKNNNLTDNWVGNLEYIFLEDAKKQKLSIPVRVKSKSEEKEEEVVKHIEVDYKTYENENEEWKKINKDIEISNFGNMRYFETKTIINKFYVFNGYYYFIHKKAQLLEQKKLKKLERLQKRIEKLSKSLEN